MKFYVINDNTVKHKLKLSTMYDHVVLYKDGKFFIRDQEVDLEGVEPVESCIVRRKGESFIFKGLYYGVLIDNCWAVFEADGTQVVYSESVPGGWGHMEVVQ